MPRQRRKPSPPAQLPSLSKGNKQPLYINYNPPPKGKGKLNIGSPAPPQELPPVIVPQGIYDNAKMYTPPSQNQYLNVSKIQQPKKTIKSKKKNSSNSRKSKKKMSGEAVYNALENKSSSNNYLTVLPAKQQKPAYINVAAAKQSNPAYLNVAAAKQSNPIYNSAPKQSNTAYNELPKQQSNTAYNDLPRQSNGAYNNVAPQQSSQTDYFNIAPTPLGEGSCLDTDSCPPLQQLLLDTFSSNSELKFSIKEGRWIYKNFIENKKVMIPNTELKKWVNEKGSMAPELLKDNNVLDIVPPNSILINNNGVVFNEMVGVSPENNYYKCGDAQCIGLNYKLYEDNLTSSFTLQIGDLKQQLELYKFIYKQKSKKLQKRFFKSLVNAFGYFVPTSLSKNQKDVLLLETLSPIDFITISWSRIGAIFKNLFKLHDNNIVHGNINKSNIMIHSKNKKIKYVDLRYTHIVGKDIGYMKSSGQSDTFVKPKLNIIGNEYDVTFVCKYFDLLNLLNIQEFSLLNSVIDKELGVGKLPMNIIDINISKIDNIIDIELSADKLKILEDSYNYLKKQVIKEIKKNSSIF
jgi:hypothetical protein